MSGLTLILLFAFLLFAVVTWIGSTRLITPKRRGLEPRHHELLNAPEAFGLSLEPFTVLTYDGYNLSGIIATRAKDPGPAPKTRAMRERLNEDDVPSLDRPRGTIFLLHGRGGRKEDMLSIAQRFVAADFRCVVYDARAHGKSEGRYCTFGVNEVRDLASAVEQLDSRLRQTGESSGPIGLFGNSLGAAVSLQSLARENPALAVVATSPFASLPEIIVQSGRKIIHPQLPRWIITSSMKVGGWRARFDPFQIKPEAIVKASATPLFIIHGSIDGTIPVAHGKRIHDQSRASDKVWREIMGAHHGNVLAEGGDDLYEEMVHFYLKHLIPTPSS